MSEVKWIKITTDIFNDEKMLLIESMPDSDSIIVIWFKLLSLAGKSNNGGLVMMSDKVPYTKEMLPILFRRKPAVVDLALLTFEKFGMIEILDNNTILISNWEKHQNVKGLEEIREKNRIRQKKFRDNQKLLLENKDKEEDKELDIDIEGNVTNNVTHNKRVVSKRFVIPTVEEIDQYCKERNNNISPNAFYDFYESKGWLVGKNKMKDWKAAIRTWERNRKDTSNKNVDEMTAILEAKDREDKERRENERT